MKNSQESLQPLGGKAVLLSIKPKYADLILAGSKRVEFRRAWAVEPVKAMALYSSSPKKMIVGVALVSHAIEASQTDLWEYAKSHGGGLTRQELRDYFFGKEKGFALLIEKVETFKNPVDPNVFFSEFHAPQSYRYLSVDEYRRLLSSGK